MKLISAKDHHTFVKVSDDYYVVMLCGHHIADVFRTDEKRNWWIVYPTRVEPRPSFIQSTEAIRKYVAAQTLYLWPEANFHVVA